MFYLEQQLNFLYFIQEARGPLVDLLFRFLNFFDSDHFEIFLVAFIWIGCSVKWGRRIAFLLIANGLVNYAGKELFGMPRPFHYDPSLALVEASRYGLPSGGAQLTFLLGSLLIYYWKHKWAWPLGISYILIISFSRLFLGVHFPADVLAGWILASLIFLIFSYAVVPIEGISRKNPGFSFAASVLSAIALGLLFPYAKVILLMSALSTLSLGVYISCAWNLYTPVPTVFKKIIIGTMGVTSLVIPYTLIQNFNVAISPIILMAAICLWTSLGFHLCLSRVNFKKAPRMALERL